MSFGFSLQNRLSTTVLDENLFQHNDTTPTFSLTRRNTARNTTPNTNYHAPIMPTDVSVLGNISALPHKKELSAVYKKPVDHNYAARIIIVNPNPTLLHSIISNDLSGEIVLIFTENVIVSNVPRNATVFTLAKQQENGFASVITRNNNTYISGKLAIVLLYRLLFNYKTPVTSIFSYRLNYFCSQEILKHQVSYNNTKNVNELINHDDSNKIDTTKSTVIYACHFDNKQAIKINLDRCKKLASAIKHENIVCVFSLSSKMKGNCDYINKLTTNKLFFIHDDNNVALDAGKYMLGLNSIDVDKIYSKKGVITLFNDSVLMSNDLVSFSNDYKNAINSNDIISCISSMEKSYHMQSWFNSFINHNAMKDFIQLLSFISIDTTNDVSIRQSIIDQMEVGLSTFLALKYKTRPLYPVHNMYYGSVMHDPNERAQNIRIALKLCGCPFIKKKLITDFGSKSVGFNYHNFL